MQSRQLRLLGHQIAPARNESHENKGSRQCRDAFAAEKWAARLNYWTLTSAELELTRSRGGVRGSRKGGRGTTDSSDGTLAQSGTAAGRPSKYPRPNGKPR